MTAMMSIYLFRLAFKKMGLKGALVIFTLPVAIIAALVGFLL